MSLRGYIRLIYKFINRQIFLLKKIFIKQIIQMDSVEAEKNLENVVEWPKGTVNAVNTLKKSHDLMIIIPAYNSEKWIDDCLGSVLSQNTKYTYHIVVINDGSTDNTADILIKYENDSRVEIIDQENRGFSGARNRGLQTLIGKYLMFLDSDDQLLPNSIERLLDAAYQNDAEIVEGGFVEVDINNRELRRVAEKNNRHVNSGLELRGYPVAKVFKSELFEHVIFPEGFWFEDSIIMWTIQYKVTKAFTIGNPVYRRLIHSTSITATAQKNIKSIHSYYITYNLWQELSQNQIEFSPLLIEQMHNQLSVNYIRTKYQDEKLLKSAFVLMRDVYIKVLPIVDSVILKKKNRIFDKAIRECDYGMYSLICNYWRWL